MRKDEIAEISAASEIEAVFTRQIADAPVMSEKRVLCAEMIMVCKFYRDLIDPKDNPEPEYAGHF